jgi:hypothetical protein
MPLPPGANIVLIECSSFPGPNWIDVVNAITVAVPAVGASVVSMSFGGSEFSGENDSSPSSFDDGIFTAAGVAYVAGTGDCGAAPSGPAGWEAYPEGAEVVLARASPSRPIKSELSPRP